MAAYNATNIANAIPKIFSKDALAVFNSTRVFSKLFKDVSSKMTLGGNTYQQTTYTDIGSANTKTAGSSITLDSATLGKVDLVINTWVEKSFAIEADILEDINVSIPFIQDTIEMCSIKCAEALEKSIGALFGTFTTKVGNSSSALDIDTLLDAQQTAFEKNIQGEKFLLVSPKNAYQLLKSANATYTLDVNKMGNRPLQGEGLASMANKPIPMSSILGNAIYMSNFVPHVSGNNGHFNLYATRDAIMFATRTVGFSRDRNGVGIISLPINDKLEYTFCATIKYGVAKLRDTDGAVVVLAN